MNLLKDSLKENKSFKYNTFIHNDIIKTHHRYKEQSDVKFTQLFNQELFSIHLSAHLAFMPPGIAHYFGFKAVSYTHLTLPTRRTV